MRRKRKAINGKNKVQIDLLMCLGKGPDFYRVEGHFAIKPLSKKRFLPIARLLLEQSRLDSIHFPFRFNFVKEGW